MTVSLNSDGLTFDFVTHVFCVHDAMYCIFIVNLLRRTEINKYRALNRLCSQKLEAKQ